MESPGRGKIQFLVTLENALPLKRPPKNVVLQPNSWMPAFLPRLRTERLGKESVPDGSFHVTAWDTLAGRLAPGLSSPLTCWRIRHQRIRVSPPARYVYSQMRVSVSEWSLQKPFWTEGTESHGQETQKDRPLPAHAPVYPDTARPISTGSFGCTKRKGVCWPVSIGYFLVSGPLIAMNKRKGASTESGCLTSAAHLVAFGELMGFRRSPLELCLWQQ